MPLCPHEKRHGAESGNSLANAEQEEASHASPYSWQGSCLADGLVSSKQAAVISVLADCGRLSLKPCQDMNGHDADSVVCTSS